MIIDFLKQYQQELISEKIELKETVDLLETKINEEKKFVEVLDSSNDSYFSDFSPRDLNIKNRAKADEVRVQIEKYTQDYDKASSKMRFIDSRLDKIQFLITSAKTENSKNSSTNHDLSFRLESVLNFISVDPNRAEIELRAIIDSLK